MAPVRLRPAVAASLLLAVFLAGAAYLTFNERPWFCSVICGHGVCPPCPGDPTPVGRTPIAVPVRGQPAPTPGR